MMRSGTSRKKNYRKVPVVLLLLVMFATIHVYSSTCSASSPQKTFASAGDAEQALIDAVRADDAEALISLFGAGSRHLVLSGDPVEDQKGRHWFIDRYERKHNLVEANPRMVILHIGDDDWPFPFPIVKSESGWKFDTTVGRQEILARRIGRNELGAIQVCLAYVDAQKEYATDKARQGQSLLEYAQRFVSTPGMRNGLYWESASGEEQSPMGPLFAAAREQGYGEKPLGGKTVPYHGYFYRILKAQGKNAPGGAHTYLVHGKMIGGFALIAYPAHYRASGVMTFIVNQDGVVYQKDLGKQTGRIARNVKEFDPDATWIRVAD